MKNFIGWVSKNPWLATIIIIKDMNEILMSVLAKVPLNNEFLISKILNFGISIFIAFLFYAMVKSYQQLKKQAEETQAKLEKSQAESSENFVKLERSQAKANEDVFMLFEILKVVNSFRIIKGTSYLIRSSSDIEEAKQIVEKEKKEIFEKMKQKFPDQLSEVNKLLEDFYF